MVKTSGSRAFKPLPVGVPEGPASGPRSTGSNVACSPTTGGQTRRAESFQAHLLPHAVTRPGPARGSFYQLLSLAGWTSLPRLPRLRRPALILAGDDDPIIPLANGRGSRTG
jgi:pimeloyl-ACP methyl ester carboxylesterase